MRDSRWWWPPLPLHGAAFTTLLAGAAVWIAAEVAVRASAYGVSEDPVWQRRGVPVELPGGSWLDDAQDVSWRGNQLCARLSVGPAGWRSDCVAVQEGQRFENVEGNFQVERPTRFPGGTWMLSAANARLEGNLFFATLRRRNLTWAEAHAVVWDGVYLLNDDGAFKLLMQSCELLDCLKGYVMRFNATYIYCEYLKCHPVIDRDTCCEPAMPCENITTCPFETLPDPEGFCLATTCDEARDRPHCCIPSALCYNLPRCVVGYTHLPGGGDNRCPRTACDPVLDRDTCCTPAASCTNLSSYECPHTFYFNTSWWCDGVVCEEERDRDICCMPAESCGNSTVDPCTHGYVQKANLTDHYCDGYKCDVNRDKPFCCDHQEPCHNLTCPHGFTTLDDTFCEQVECDPAVDTAHCCVDKAPCTDLVGRQCPFGHFFNTTDFCAHVSCVEARDRPLCCQVAEPCTDFVCPVSYILKVGADSLFCEGIHCDQNRDLNRCCDVAEPCTQLFCPHGYTKRPNATRRYCLGPSCVVSRDRDVCCEDAAYCADEYTCPHGFVLRNDTYCDGPTCEAARDLYRCCDHAMPCTNLTCPWNHIHTPDHYCPEVTCDYARDVDHCCELGVPVRFVRFSPVQLRAITADDLFKPVVQLQELTPYFHNMRTALATATAYAVNGDYPQAENPNKAIDDDLVTKWLDFQSTPIYVDYSTQEKINTFTVTTGNDMPSRDPIGWRFEGSTDGVTYALLHNLSDGYAEVPTARLAESQHFPIDVPCLPPKPDIANGDSPLCAEGSLVSSGSNCTPACASGYTPSVSSLACAGGVLTPSTFTCV